MIPRQFVIAALALGLGFQVVRTAAMERPAPRQAIGAWMWPSHPAFILDRTMAEIGALARHGQKLPPTTLQHIKEIARKTPLAPEPYLIHGALAQESGQVARAERLFAQARLRDPRSETARYFLADRYLRSGRTGEALVEITAFSRLVPTAAAQFAPALASFAHTPGAIPQLRGFFRSSPEFEPLVLDQLAADVRNTDLILALAVGRPAGDPPQPWQAKIVGALVEQEQFTKAYDVWKKITGLPNIGGGLFNSEFDKVEAPPPFNWTFATSGGVAEPSGGGRLQVIYYGREDTALAQQLLLLSPGQYQLRMDVSGQVGDGTAIAWSLTCLPQKRAIISLPLKQGMRQAVIAFLVSPDCPAQRLDLIGSAGEFPRSLDFAVSKLKLTRIAGP